MWEVAGTKTGFARQHPTSSSFSPTTSAGRNWAATATGSTRRPATAPFTPSSTARRNPHLARMLRSIDDGIGMIMEKLAQLGLAASTMVVFTSDNGGEARRCRGSSEEATDTMAETDECRDTPPGRCPVGSRPAPDTVRRGFHPRGQ
ncbi:MAG TPA: sulfatase-like hydrolase/transferase [Phycisphaerae bacterium]|nr:sulfatase-like hydrolase/transferase [Phycisphaerae bacterium]